MDTQVARFNMIESQIRTWDVFDQRILDLYDSVPRDAFVPEAMRGLAYADMEVPLGHGAAMLAPKLEARMLQELQLQPTDRVLEIGTGSGFSTTLLSHLVAHVVSVERVPELAAAAQTRIQARGGRGTVVVETGDAALGWPTRAPYDAILVTAALPLVPDEMLAQLAPGGRLLAVVGAPPIQTARLFTRAPAGGFASTGLFETRIAPLVNARAPERFVF
ncbi:MAG: protein-L-isoaspartate O-methyltransferase [Burkholderiales bacterium]|nr:protein-L-isoaspartate O-methyltransferase [Burkholderiales bacterium]